ncbi:MAG: sugar phosphate isomerase/epimerase [Candidatus Omnitrophica bacterium]|nr:sugar phosphate isomerase/epimerase [Candidatus Omnitrophota bacterium]
MYISSACVTHEKIKDSVEELALNGFKDIELSGGTKYYQGYEEDLLRLKERYNLHYLVHNYFPPPNQDFILNLASLNDELYQKTLGHYQGAIALSRKLGARKFGLHAGFLMDFTAKEIGKDISWSGLYDKDKAMERFCEGYDRLREAAKDVELYIENNVLSSANAQTFQGQEPFMLMDHRGYVELKDRIDFKLLLDVAHLNVSAHSLGLDFIGQLDKLLPVSDYVHLSDNDGYHDQGRCFCENSRLLSVLKEHDFRNKTVTTETYGSVSDIKLSQSIVKRSLQLYTDKAPL